MWRWHRGHQLMAIPFPPQLDLDFFSWISLWISFSARPLAAELVVGHGVVVTAVRLARTKICSGFPSRPCGKFRHTQKAASGAKAAGVKP